MVNIGLQKKPFNIQRFLRQQQNWEIIPQQQAPPSIETPIHVMNGIRADIGQLIITSLDTTAD